MKKENKTIEELPEFLTLREVAGIIRITPLTLKRWGKRGILVPIRINKRGDRRYLKSAILKYLEITPRLENQLKNL